MSTSTVSYQCPNCGAGLSFNADKHAFTCEFCLSEFTEEEIEKTDSHKKAEEAEENAKQYCENMNEYHCPSCGAEIVADENTAASFCYYCHNPIVLTGKLSGEKQPTKIVPFKYGKDEAMNKFLEFAKKKLFVPKDFTYKEQIEKISGVYYPFWVTDVDTDSGLDATATKIRSWKTGKYLYTETSYFKVHRRGNIHFEDIVNSAITDADKKMLEGILPFPSSAQQDFSMMYLSGFTAKKRNIERESLSDSVRQSLNRYSDTLLRKTISGYSTCTTDNLNVNVLKSHWDYSLMPLWILTYRNNKGKVFTFAMNGYTGKVYGELPISPIKLAVGALISAVGTGLIAGLIGGLFFI